MTNSMIILDESIKLMEKGIIAGTGKFITVENKDGSKEQRELPEAIHTFQHWKSLGYSVKKGEHAIAKFAIWKCRLKTETMIGKDIVTGETVEEEVQSNKMFMTQAAFFKASQVEARA